MNRYEEKRGCVRLLGRTERRGSHLGLSNWGGGLFGGVFVAVGGGIALVGLHVVPVDPGTVHAPYSVLTVVGLVFASCGAMVWGMVVKQMRAQQRQAQHGDPVQADFPWDPRGYPSSAVHNALAAWGGTLFFLLFMSIFNWWAFGTPNPGGVVIGVTLLFDLFALAACVETFRRTGIALKFGESSIRFARFPYRCGQPVVVRWVPPTGVERIDSGSATLRCVKEWYETTGDSDRTRSLVHEQQWAATWRLDMPQTVTPGSPVEFKYTPPAEAPSTALAALAPVFWEFEIKLAMPGLDFEETYLVPVYG